ncbi:MAG: YciI family protein [Acidobacteriota bacterium]
MKFILMMNMKTDAESMSKGIMTWPKEAIQEHIQFMMRFNKELKEEGAFLVAEGLAFPQEAKIVRAGKDGNPITDGVFPETKEFLMGYWIVQVDTPEQAYAIAARASAAPGPGSVPLNMPIEVRQVMAGPPTDFE